MSFRSLAVLLLDSPCNQFRACSQNSLNKLRHPRVIDGLWANLPDDIAQHFVVNHSDTEYASFTTTTIFLDVRGSDRERVLVGSGHQIRQPRLPFPLVPALIGEADTRSRLRACLQQEFVGHLRWSNVACLGSCLVRAVTPVQSKYTLDGLFGQKRDGCPSVDTSATGRVEVIPKCLKCPGYSQRRIIFHVGEEWCGELFRGRQK